MTNNPTDTLTRYLSGTLLPDERLEATLPHHPDSCELLVACPPGNYSASALAKAVEDCDAQLLALSVTGMRDAEGRLVVMLRANTRADRGIVRSLERYGYETLHSTGNLTPEARAEAMARVNELLHYLEI